MFAAQVGSLATGGSVFAGAHPDPTPQKGDQATLAGSLKTTGGTGKYHNAVGSLVVAGNVNEAGMVTATLKGAFTR